MSYVLLHAAAASFPLVQLHWTKKQIAALNCVFNCIVLVFENSCTRSANFWAEGLPRKVSHLKRDEELGLKAMALFSSHMNQK